MAPLNFQGVRLARYLLGQHTREKVLFETVIGGGCVALLIFSSFLSTFRRVGRKTHQSESPVRRVLLDCTENHGNLLKEKEEKNTDFYLF